MSTAIDFKDLMERLGDEELIEEIVPEFLDPQSKYIDIITAAIDSGEASAIASSAHALKGASASIGALALSESAKLLEDMGKSNDISSAQDLLKRVVAHFDEVETLLNRSDWMAVIKAG